MKKNLTELVVVSDKRGSMSGYEADTLAGYNAMLKNISRVIESKSPSPTRALLSSRRITALISLASSQVPSLQKKASFEALVEVKVSEFMTLPKEISNSKERTCPYLSENSNYFEICY